MRYVLARTGRAVLTVWVAVTLTFGIIRLIPSGPIEQMRQQIALQNPGLGREQIESRVADKAAQLNLDIDAALHEQYLDYLAGLLRGDLGTSFHYAEPVTAIIGQSLPWTLFVVTTATVLVAAIAVTWGAIIAYSEGSVLDSVSSGVGIVMSSIPFYVLAFVLILVFGFKLGWLPKSGKVSALQPVEPSLTFAVDAFLHAILPIAAVVLSQFGLQTLGMRGNSIQILGRDYVRVARLRGIADRRIATRYVARNAILPMYTGFLTLVGFLLGASIILEEVFTYRGLGWYMFQGLENRDYALVMGTFLVYAVALVLAVYVADLTYSRLDPRVKQGESSEAY